MVQANPYDSESWRQLGVCLFQQLRYGEAVTALQKSVALTVSALTISGLGLALHMNGRSTEGAHALEQAIALEPSSWDAQLNLGLVLQSMGRTNDSIRASQAAIQLRPNVPEAWMNLGTALHSIGKMDDAAQAYRQVLSLDPNQIGAHKNLGNVLLACGESEQAVLEYQKRGLAKTPKDSDLWSNLLFALPYSPACGHSEMAGTFSRWRSIFENSVPRFSTYQNDRNPDRPLRIGYLSADFRNHSGGRMLLPWFEHRNRRTFHVTCYSNTTVEDAVTGCLRGLVDNWRDITRLNDPQAAAQINQDKIDILVDLSMHSAGGRPFVVMRKPAPIQVSYLAYCGTTGMSTVDYRFSDPFMDSPADSTSWYAERTMRLPASYWCYAAPMEPQVFSPREMTRNAIVFGCLNNFSKVSRESLSTWAKILAQVPSSILILHAPLKGATGNGF